MVTSGSAGAQYMRVVVAEKSAPPPPPPPMPPMPPPPEPLPPVPLKSGTMKSNKSSGDTELVDELRTVLPQLSQRRKLLEFKKTPDIFIHQKSSPNEVSDWLEAKGFSPAAQKQLAVPGHQLFALPRTELERLLGQDEGKRLYSQVLVQRNVSGYKTTSASELQSILRKLREKVEVS